MKLPAKKIRVNKVKEKVPFVLVNASDSNNSELTNNDQPSNEFYLPVEVSPQDTCDGLNNNSEIDTTPSTISLNGVVIEPTQTTHLLKSDENNEFDTDNFNNCSGEDDDDTKDVDRNDNTIVSTYSSGSKVNKVHDTEIKNKLKLRRYVFIWGTDFSRRPLFLEPV